MSIKLEFSKGSFRSEAVLRDAALPDLIHLIEKHQTDVDSAQTSGTRVAPAATKTSGQMEFDAIGKVKEWLSKHTASEILTRFNTWATNYEKILLLAAFHEATDGQEGWKSADISARFDQARERLPSNLSRDLSQAVTIGYIGTVTPRSYRVGRKGWEAISQVIATPEP